jgi:hypothetical protein
VPLDLNVRRPAPCLAARPLPAAAPALPAAAPRAWRRALAAGRCAVRSTPSCRRRRHSLLQDSLDRIVPEGRMYRHLDEGPDDMPAHVKVGAGGREEAGAGLHMVCAVPRGEAVAAAAGRLRACPAGADGAPGVPPPQSSLMGPSLTIPVGKGRLFLGTWQVGRRLASACCLLPAADAWLWLRGHFAGMGPAACDCASGPRLAAPARRHELAATPWLLLRAGHLPERAQELWRAAAHRDHAAGAAARGWQVVQVSVCVGGCARVCQGCARGCARMCGGCASTPARDGGPSFQQLAGLGARRGAAASV